MEVIIEFILELFLEGSLEIGTNKKVSKWIKYPLILIVALFYGSLISLFIFLSLNIIKENPISGVIFLIIAIVLIIGTIYLFKKKYRELNK